MLIKFPDRASKQPPEKRAAKVDAASATVVELQENYVFPRHILADLPFVDPPMPHGADGRCRSPQNCWNDIPTDDSQSDFDRGQRYAKMTVAAMEEHSEAYGGHKLARSISATDLEHIIESMIRDGIARREKGGRYSRSTLTSAMQGFLSELSRYVAGIRE
jgi:hypothetical protein